MISDLLNRFFPKEFTCPICTESHPTEKRFRNKKGNCHPRYCTDCIARYVKVEVEDNRKLEVKCPSPHCKNLLDPLWCRPFLSPGTFAVWCDILAEDLVLRLEPSYCPNPRCSEPVLISKCSNFGTRAECPNCKEEFCLKPIDKNYVSFVQLAVEKGWKRCPKCRTCVERTFGCPKMICRCGTSFCYDCGKTPWVFFHECLPERSAEFTMSSLVE